MMQFGNMSGWGMGFMWFGVLIMIGLFIWFTWFVVTINDRTTKNSSHYSGDDALDILKKRYACGEISKEEFE